MTETIRSLIFGDVVDIPIIDPEPPNPIRETGPVFLAIGISIAALALLIFVIVRIRRNRK